MKHIVSLSGGKDSTALLLMMLEKGMPIDYVVFVDTTKEFPEIYDHLEKLERYIAPLQITKLSFDYDYYFAEIQKRRGTHKDKKGYSFPTIWTRWCTALKRDLMARFLNSLGDDYTIYVGIAYDEKKRTKSKKHYRYPLVEWEITEKQALEYCYSKGFDFGGIYNKMNRTSCYCCPLVGIAKLKAIYTYYPELWEKIKEMERKTWRKFRPDFSIFEIERQFELEKNNGKLFHYESVVK
jgi:3'-phosphoadenosine 5'-phosphosulfate sulfotransferase (PAPS reductase)/FAD synthetase